MTCTSEVYALIYSHCAELQSLVDELDQVVQRFARGNGRERDEVDHRARDLQTKLNAHQELEDGGLTPHLRAAHVSAEAARLLQECQRQRSRLATMLRSTINTLVDPAEEPELSECELLHRVGALTRVLREQIAEEKRRLASVCSPENTNGSPAPADDHDQARRAARDQALSGSISARPGSEETP